MAFTSRLINQTRMSILSNNMKLRPLASSLCQQTRLASGFSMVQSQSPTLNKEFWNKNKEMKRPISPHLGIYKIQLTTTLSIFHRITGAGVGVLLYGGGIASLAASGVSFPELLFMIQNNVPHILIVASKTAVGGGIIYHTLNGIRHLVWDMGYGFQLKHLYLSGYIVVGLTALGTLAIAIKG